MNEFVIRSEHAGADLRNETLLFNIKPDSVQFDRINTQGDGQ